MVYVVFWTGFYPTQNKHMQKNIHIWGKNTPKQYHISNEGTKNPGGLYLHYNFVVALHLGASLPGGFVGMKGGITNPPQN